MGRPAIITKERVAEVTLRIIDEEGLDAVSIERIASELGVRGPSLYHHFADKAAILTEVARLVLGDLDLDRPVGGLAGVADRARRCCCTTACSSTPRRR